MLAKSFEWAKKLNSQARQASSERAWSAISRFFDNCKKRYQAKLVLSEAEVKDSQNLRNVDSQLSTNKLGGNFLKIGNT